MSIKTKVEERAKFREVCREKADHLMFIIIEELDRIPEDQQRHVLSMLMTELQIAQRQSDKEKAG